MNVAAASSVVTSFSLWYHFLSCWPSHVVGYPLGLHSCGPCRLHLPENTSQKTVGQAACTCAATCSEGCLACAEVHSFSSFWCTKVQIDFERHITPALQGPSMQMANSMLSACCSSWQRGPDEKAGLQSCCSVHLLGRVFTQSSLLTVGVLQSTWSLSMSGAIVCLALAAGCWCAAPLLLLDGKEDKALQAAQSQVAPAFGRRCMAGLDHALG